MNFIVLQHGYHRRIIQQVGSEKRFHYQFIWPSGSDEEHIITAGWWCKPVVFMNYQRRLVRQSGGDSYQPEHFYELAVILSITITTAGELSPMVLIISAVI